MKTFLKQSVTGAILTVSSWCLGQTNTPPEPENVPALTLEQQPQLLNRISLSYRMGLNMKVDFRNLGGLQLSDPGPATGSAYNRNYDNGYNRVDISGNRGDLTWNWGYSSPNSSQPGSLVLQSDSTPSTASSGRYQDGVQNGVELSYSREFKRAKHWRAGLEAGLGYTSVSIKDEQTLSYYVNRTSDTFGIGPVILPLPPYAGTFQGPGPLISSALTPADRSTTALAGAATIIGQRQVDSDVFTLRLGPYFEVPFYRKWAVTLSGGLLLAIADTRFTFQESVLISDPFYNINLASTPRSGSGSQTDFLVGGYAGANLSYALSEKVRLFAGAMFQAAGEAVNNEKGKQSFLDMGSSVVVSVGVAYSF